MKRLAIALGVAACTPCEGQRNITDGYVPQAQLEPELAKCAGRRVCLDPCADLFAFTSDDQLLACKIDLDSSGGGTLHATYIDWSVCAADGSVDVGGGGYVDDGSSDTGDDGTSDDGSDDSPPDDGAPPDDGTPDDGTGAPDDGTGGDDGATGRIAPARHAWSTLAPAPRRR